jgi:RNA-directed DNA polymerase
MSALSQISLLQRVLHSRLGDLEDIVENIDTYYREKIQRKRGKERTLLIPNRKLKRVQRRLARRVLGPLPVHPAAYCHRGRGVVLAAERHARHRYLLKLDIADFFPSVNPDRVQRCLVALGGSSRISRLLTGLTTFRGHLPQGAPSSVAVGNLVLLPLDRRLGELCRRMGLAYTRYVDDIAISGGARVERIERTVRKIVADEGFMLNDKGGLIGPDERHTYLGLILNAKPNIDSTYLRDLHYTLRKLRAAETPLTTKDRKRLWGRILYVRTVRPQYGKRLADEFGGYLHPPPRTGAD